jgi:hypothetical protein
LFLVDMADMCMCFCGSRFNANGGGERTQKCLLRRLITAVLRAADQPIEKAPSFILLLLLHRI